MRIASSNPAVAGDKVPWMYQIVVATFKCKSYDSTFDIDTASSCSRGDRGLVAAFFKLLIKSKLL